MKVLVTGGAGFIGSHTVDLLLEKGYEVRVMDSLEPPVHPNGAKPDCLPGDVEFVPGDIRDRERLMRALQGVDAVFHLAAYQDYLPNFSKFAQVNDGGTALLYEIIVNEKLPVQKVVVASSQAVYGEGKYLCREHGHQYPPPRPLSQLKVREWDIRCGQSGCPMESVLIDETHVNPHNQYAISKYAQEMYSLILGRRYGIPTVAMRYAIVQGPRQSFFNAYSGVLRIFSTRLLNSMPLPVYEDGKQRRNYVYVGDVARANLLVLEREEANYQVYNVASHEVTSVLEYAQLLIGLTGKNIEVKLTSEFRFGDTRHILSDITKLTGLGWHPDILLNEIAASYLSWIQGQPHVADSYSSYIKEMRRTGMVRAATQQV